MDSVCKDIDETLRENIFHARCMVMGKICSLIIDGGSCTNVASQRLIENLALKTSPHPRPYKLQWLSKNVKLVIDRQVLICFSIEKYVNEILFNVVPMEASRLLLGRPWQYDRNIVHNGVTNRFSFVHKGKQVTLTHLSPSEVCEDQIKTRVKREQERKEKKNKIIERREKKEKSGDKKKE